MGGRIYARRMVTVSSWTRWFCTREGRAEQPPPHKQERYLEEHFSGAVMIELGRTICGTVLVGADTRRLGQ
eukprot:COSAG06_NODE_31118_length_526_cov_2.946136_1_plen_70_part_10